MGSDSIGDVSPSLRTDLPEPALLALVSRNTGVSPTMLRVALRYWASYPEEVDAEIAANEVAEQRAAIAFQRQQDLLRRR